MPIYANERKPFPWKWLAALFILILLCLYFYRKDLPFYRQSGTETTADSTATPPAWAPAPKEAKGGQFIGETAVSVPSPTGIPVSDNWYMKVAFRGQVLNEQNRSAIPGAKVSVYAYASPGATVEKLTGVRGEFEVIAPPAYRYDVKAEADGFRSYEENSFVITRPYYQMEILLSPTEMLRGRVVDGQNAGIPDALVQLAFEGDRSPPAFSVTSDARGAFTFPQLPRSGRFNLDAFHPGYDTTGTVRVSIPAENEVIVRMASARSTGTVTGTVTDKAQKPVPGAQIELYETSDGRLTASIQTDPQGGYRFARVREGYYLVRCSAEGYTDTRANQITVMVTVNREARADFSIDPGLAVNGIVVNQRNEPVPDAQITYSQVSEQDAPAGRQGQRGDMQRPRLHFTSTEKDGRFQIAGLTDTPIQITISHRDYLSMAARLRPSSQEQTLMLDSGIILRGTVSDPRGAAVERFTLTLRSSSGRSEKTYSFTTTDGHFEIHGLSKDLYQVNLRGAGRGNFAGSLDLQGPADINILLDNVPGGRGQSTMNILKSK